jgi:hypothetical protein
MSFIYRDSSVIPRSILNLKIATYKNFDAYWGKHIINVGGKDIRVYNDKRFYYRKGFIVDTVSRKFIKSLGLNWEDFTSQKIDNEVESMWFYLKGGYKWDGAVAYSGFDKVNPTKPALRPAVQNIIDDFNNSFEIGEKVKCTVSYGGDLKRYISDHELLWTTTGVSVEAGSLNKEHIRSVLHSNPWYYFVNSRHLPYIKDSNPFQLYDGGNVSVPLTTYKPSARTLPTVDVYGENNVLSIFALLGDVGVFKPILDDDGDIKIIDENETTYHTDDGEAIRYTYTIEYEFRGVSRNSQLIKDIDSWFSVYNQNIQDIKYKPTDPDKYREEMITSTIDTKFKKVMSSMMEPDIQYYLDGKGEDELYVYESQEYNGFDRTYNPPKAYLKVDTVAKMKKHDFVDLLGNQLKTDYAVEKASWFERLLAVIIIVIAVVVAVVICTTGVGCAASPALIASALGGATVALTVGSLILSEIGGLSANGLVKVIGKFAQITGILSMVVGIYAAFNAMWQKAAEEVAKEVGKETAEVTVKEALSQIASSALDSIKSTFTDFANKSVMDVVSSIGDVLKVATKGYDYYLDNEKKKLQREYDELKAEEEAFNEEVLNRDSMSAPAVYYITHERLSTPDMLQDLAIELELASGGDASYTRWNNSVNA